MQRRQLNANTKAQEAELQRETEVLIEKMGVQATNGNIPEYGRSIIDVLMNYQGKKKIIASFLVMYKVNESAMSKVWTVLTPLFLILKNIAELHYFSAGRQKSGPRVFFVEERQREREREINNNRYIDIYSHRQHCIHPKHGQKYVRRPIPTHRRC